MARYYVLYEHAKKIGVFPIGHINGWADLTYGMQYFEGQIRTDVVNVLGITNQKNLGRLVNLLLKESPKKQLCRHTEYV